MNKRPGHVNVTTELGYCSVCGRPRNLRREEHQLGTFVRTVVTCETCHRTLSSTMGVSSAEAPAGEPEAATAEAAADQTPERAATNAPPATKSQPAKRGATTAKKASPKPKAPKARTTKSR
ncbi:MAG: hypothetical protein ACYDA0_03155 [Candidatus Dormibacteraceae bacterium]